MPPSLHGQVHLGAYMPEHFCFTCNAYNTKSHSKCQSNLLGANFNHTEVLDAGKKNISAFAFVYVFTIPVHGAPAVTKAARLPNVGRVLPADYVH